MLRYEEALDIVLRSAYSPGVEYVRFMDSLDRVLAEDVISDTDLPPFSRSAVDGFACRREDIQHELTVIETVAAGQSPALSVGKGQCTRIMTGAAVPEGADCVIMVEDSEEIVPGKIRYSKDNTKTNISFRAEDVKAGNIVLEKGTRVAPQHIAILATVGWVNPKVAVKPKVGIISTGDEIIEPHLKPGLSQIRNSNSYQLVAQTLKAGAVPDYAGIAPDNEKITLEMITHSLENNDLVLLTGGVSMGTFDFVPQVFKKLGIEILFRTVALQPGKPTVFGIKGMKRIFGLPGNPVSSFTIFELFVRPMLNLMMGMKEPFRQYHLPLGADYQRKRKDRMQWLPVVIREGVVFPLEYHGSGHIHSLAGAHGLAAIPIGITEMLKGDIIDVRPL